MGIIAAITPGSKKRIHVPKMFVSADDLAAVGRIKITYYQEPENERSPISFKPLPLKIVDDLTSNKADLLWKVSPPIRYPCPDWSGMMQMVHKGIHPGKASVQFLPLIDLQSSDPTCIYLTMFFVCKQAKYYNFTPVLTFDQPLWWKALNIFQHEPQTSDLKSIVLRLGGFHIQMSFLGSIGHIMAGSGLQEVLETIYAEQTVRHMLSGKAVDRAIRGHMITDAVLHSLVIKKKLLMLLCQLKLCLQTLQKRMQPCLTRSRHSSHLNAWTKLGNCLMVF